jgi:hypothetical protein
MSDVFPQPGCERQMAGRGAELEGGGQFEFQMIQRGDLIKPGSWHWRCRRESSAGDVSYGYVQADALGQSIATDTFEKDQS